MEKVSGAHINSVAQQLLMPDAGSYAGTVLSLDYVRSSQGHTVDTCKVTHSNRSTLNVYSKAAVRDLYKRVFNSHLNSFTAVSAMYAGGILLEKDLSLAIAWRGYSCITRGKDTISYADCLLKLKHDIRNLFTQEGDTVVKESVLESSKLLRSAVNCKNMEIDKLRAFATRLRKVIGKDSSVTFTPSVKGVSVVLVYKKSKEGYTLYNGLLGDGTKMSLPYLLGIKSIPNNIPKRYQESLLRLEGEYADSIAITGVITVTRKHYASFKKEFSDRESKVTITEAVDEYLGQDFSEIKGFKFFTFVAEAVFAHLLGSDEFSYVNVKKNIMATHVQSLGFYVVEIPDFFKRTVPLSDLSSRTFKSKVKLLDSNDQVIIKGFWVAPNETAALKKVPRVNFLF